MNFIANLCGTYHVIPIIMRLTLQNKCFLSWFFIIIPLLFADVLLNLCKDDCASVSLVKEQLDNIFVSFDLRENQDKSAVYMVGVSNEVSKDICHILRIRLGSLSFRYLWVLLSHKKLTYSQCLALVRSTYKCKS